MENSKVKLPGVKLPGVKCSDSGIDTVRSIIVEDEAQNRENLARLIAAYCPQVEVVAQCSTAAEARQTIIERHPGLVFLDIEMPGGNGFSLLESLPDAHFEVIFVTAYDSYGIKAIKFSALDYILKPIDPDELREAVKKASQKIAQKEENLRMLNLLQNTRREPSGKMIALSLAESIEFVQVSSIVRCESDSNYTTFYLKSGERLIASRTLKEFDELLAPYGFLRVHQSHLVNISQIKSYIKSDGGSIRMKDGALVSISRQRRETVLMALKQL
jgi:two-component system LytT family response regulator